MLRVWNLSLLVATFALTILGTFLTRSGVIGSVHAFGDGTVGAVPARRSSAWSSSCRWRLIAWRGDRLRSPGAIDSPVSREGAFLANNVLFAVFAFVVLLGTVFPLIVEALQDRQIARRRPVLRPALACRSGSTLLFLMAVAPVLPWRKASTELLRDRLFWPAWCGVGALARRRRRSAPTGGRRCVAFGLGGFAAGSALRQLVLATRRQGWRGLVGRANGGMIVHIGVIVIAVALGGVEQLHQVGELSLEAGRAGRRRRAHVRARRRHVRSTTPVERVVRANVLRRRRQIVRAGDDAYLNLRRRRVRRRACAPGSPRTST